MRRTLSIAAVVVLLATPTAAVQPSCPCAEGRWQPEGPAPPVDAVDVAVRGPLAVVADATYGSSRLRVLDASHPDHPKELGRVDLPGNATAVELAPGLAAVTHATVDRDICVDGGLTLVDIDDPSRPEVISTLPLEGCVDRLAVVPGNAYVVNDGDLVVVDISSPAAPVELGRYRPELIHAFDAAVSEGVLYVADLYGKLCAADLSIPSQPQHIDCTRITEHDILALDAQGDLLAALARPDPARPYELILVDVRWPALPWRLSATRTAGRTDHVALSGGLAALGLGYSRGVQVFDVHDPEGPVEVGIDGPRPDRSHGLALSGNRLWLTEGTGGVGVYRVDLCHPPRSSARRTPG